MVDFFQMKNTRVNCGNIIVFNYRHRVNKYPIIRHGIDSGFIYKLLGFDRFFKIICGFGDGNFFTLVFGIYFNTDTVKVKISNAYKSLGVAKFILVFKQIFH